MSEEQVETEQEPTEPTIGAGEEILSRRHLLALAAVGSLLLCACGLTTIRARNWISEALAGRGPEISGSDSTAAADWPATSAELTVAVSPSMAGTLKELASSFNGLGLRTPDGELMKVELVTRSSREMVGESVQQPAYQAVTPDSSIWLRQIDRRWAELFPGERGSQPASRVGRTTLFAVSPVVIAVPLEVAQQLGWPQQSIGWKEIQARAASPTGEFNWGHPGPSSTAGIAATLSKFYAGAGITRGLTDEVAAQPEVIGYVRQAERVAYVLEGGEWAGGGPSLKEGRERFVMGKNGRPLDAFVTQEQSVIAWNRSSGRDTSSLSGMDGIVRFLPDGLLAAIYPKEGTLWADHPLTLLELDGRAGPAVTQNQRSTYRAFTAFLLDEESQFAILEAGFRPVDLTIDLLAESSQFAKTGIVDPLLPQTLMPLAPHSVLTMVLDAWRLSMPPVRIMLVVDTSESMAGSKLARTKGALHGFLDQIQGDGDKVGLVEFGSGVKRLGALQPLDAEGRGHMSFLIEEMQAGGSTRLLDAVWAAYSELGELAESDATYAIVVLTDGRDNDSEHRLRSLRRAVAEADSPVSIHTVAYGRDADGRLMEELARIGGGKFYRADEMTVEGVYRQIAASIQREE
ncbi:MAG: VWA domain-containing protein [Caldilineaceae bacterium]|nr:VWA domain-containing protein [Caldilineaceae bacterium]